MNLPELYNIAIKAGKEGARKKGVIDILPLFCNEKPESIGKVLRVPEATETLNDLNQCAAFRAKAGEVLSQVASGYILLGLGHKENFNPEILGSIMRQLGERLKRYEGLKFRLLFNAELFDALDSFSKKFEDPDRNLDLEKGQLDPKKKKSKKFQKDEEEDEEEDVYPDYFGEISGEGLVSQAISCLVIGAEAMDLLKASRAIRNKNKFSVEVIAPRLSDHRLDEAVNRGVAAGQLVNGARKLASLPGNYFNPPEAEKFLRETARKHGLKIKVFDEKKLKQMGCGGIIAVGQGSALPPRMIQLEYTPTRRKSNQRLVLVGKGITFDSGGISIKPSPAMHEMKYDMCGSALAIHATLLAAINKLPLEVICLTAFAENMPSGTALKPGDVYTAYNGVTVEVQNTDAEGRLILGDMLAYASKNLKPDVMIDFATLTGACVIALGHTAGGLMTPSEKLAGAIDRAARRSMDRIWRLPHWNAYDYGLKSEVADIRNIADRAAGTITAMRFLSNFVEPGIKWAHIDIAGTAWRSRASGTQSRGATGWGVRLMGEFFEELLRW